MAFAPPFQRPFSSPFDRRAAVAGVNWSQWFDHFWLAKGAASLAASYTDLVGAQTLTTSAAPSLVTGGWSFNGSTFLDTGVQPAGTASVLVRFTTDTTTNVSLFGARNSGSNGWILQSADGVGDNRLWDNGGRVIVSPRSAGGVMGFSGKKAWFDNGSPGTISAGSTTSTRVVYIGGFNNNGSLAGAASVIAAVGIRWAELSDAAMTAAAAAMAAL
jgi:hypothetical protein